jgi:hypothetical protein
LPDDDNRFTIAEVEHNKVPFKGKKKKIKEKPYGDNK